MRKLDLSAFSRELAPVAGYAVARHKVPCCGVLFSGIVPSAVIYGMVSVIKNTVRHGAVLFEGLLNLSL